MSFDLKIVDIPPTSQREEDWVLQIKGRLDQMPQANLPTFSCVHAGIYTRTVIMPPNCFLVGAKIKVDTLVQVCGHCIVNINEKMMELNGVHILRASAGRRQLFRSFCETYVTMSFATEQTDLHECEKQFTDEWEQLLTNRDLGE